MKGTGRGKFAVKNPKFAWGDIKTLRKTEAYKLLFKYK
jgi:hypothetical protein